jgi:hypothetical protein
MPTQAIRPTETKREKIDKEKEYRLWRRMYERWTREAGSLALPAQETQAELYARANAAAAMQIRDGHRHDYAHYYERAGKDVPPGADVAPFNVIVPEKSRAKVPEVAALRHRRHEISPPVPAATPPSRKLLAEAVAVVIGSARNLIDALRYHNDHGQGECVDLLRRGGELLEPVFSALERRGLMTADDLSPDPKERAVLRAVVELRRWDCYANMVALQKALAELGDV